jgi:hypothetical protein
MSIIQTQINPEILNSLYGLFCAINIPKTSSTESRKNSIGMRRKCFGIVRFRIPNKGSNYQLYGTSRFTKLYPEIYDELKLVINQIFPDFTYTSIQVNHNGIMDYHTDNNNMGDTVILSFGEYTGGNLVIKYNGVETEYDMNCRAVRFDASRIPHKVNDDLIGNKYSLVYFTISH